MDIRVCRKIAALAAAVTVSLVASSTQAAVIFHDGFNYTPGVDVNGQGGWGIRTYSGNLYSKVVTGLTYPGVATTGGAASIYEGGLGSGFTIASGSDYYISALAAKTNSSGPFGFTFRQGWPTNVIATFGLANNGLLFADDSSNVNFLSGSATVSSTSIPEGTTVLLVAHIDSAAQTITAWDYANPSNTVSYNFSNTETPGIIEYHTGFGGTGSVDEITIGDTLADVTPAPEPASLGLLASGALMLLRRRRTH